MATKSSRTSKPAAKKPAGKAVVKKAPAKKLAAKKVPTKKVATKKVPAKKVPAKKVPAKKAPTKKAATKKVATKSSTASAPKLLSGGNPQISMGYGDAPVQAYIEAMPGWKREVGRRLDALVVRNVPGVRKAVKWNSPFFGAPAGEGWFLNWHCYDEFIKVAFFRGALLDPPPPEPSKMKDVRYWHIRENQPLDEKRFSAWLAQAIRLPGERM